jgi:7-cyano-7-deazaguanine reductase
MDIWQRRAILDPIENPDRNIDFVSSLTGGLSAFGGRMRVTLRYVPDAKTLRPARFTAYLQTLESFDWPSHENLATTILQDVSNELVPRWVQIITHQEAGADGSPEHNVLVEDRQPQWNNPALLASLESL